MKSFKFLTNSLEHEVVGLKGEREYYVTGHISTDEIDRSNEVVTREAMNEMVVQIKAGNVKLDVEHSTFMGENDIPVGKIVDAGIDEQGVWVKCVLNKAHNRFNEYWQSIKSNFLDAFSIAYKVKDYAEEVVNGVKVTLLKSIELLNVAITGNPVNRGAKMTESFYKSLKYIEENKIKGETIMVDENVESPAPVAEPVVEPKQEVEVSEPVPEPAAPAPVPAPAPVVAPAPVTPVAVAPEPVAPAPEPAPVETPTISPLDQIKSLTAVNATLKAELDALKARVNKPLMKAMNSTAMTSAEDELNKPQIKGVQFALDAIR